MDISFEDSDKNCVICSKKLTELIEGDTLHCVHEKGVTSLLARSRKSGDGLDILIGEKNKITCHKLCYQKYLKGRRVDNLVTAPPRQSDSKRDSLRHNVAPFNFKLHCFFCGQPASFDPKHPERSDVSLVLSKEMDDTVKDTADRNTAWDQEIKLRISGIINLQAADARYHRSCFRKFVKYYVPQTEDPGRPESPEKTRTFEEITEWMEAQEDCQFSLRDLYAKMLNFAGQRDTYSEGHFRRKLKMHYGSNIIMTTFPGDFCVVCLRTSCDKVIQALWSSGAVTSNAKPDREQIIDAAAAILSEDIRSVVSNSSEFEVLDPQQLFRGIPKNLQRLVRKIIINNKKNSRRKEIKIASISHAIISAARPETILSPFQVAAGTFLHRRFGSRLLIDFSNRLGFSCPYNEVIKFATSATLGPTPEISKNDDFFLQFSYDNADINQDTLTGKDTFHCLGGIACVTPASALQPPTRIPRIKQHVPAAQLVESKTVRLSEFDKPRGLGLNQIEVKAANLPSCEEKIKIYQSLDALYLANKCQQTDEPSWSGFMLNSNKREDFSTTRIKFQPFIMLQPTNPQAVCTALEYGAQEAQNVGQAACFFTFDQPLFILAMDILLQQQQEGKLKNCLIRLGGFHTLKSFLGAIGHIMDGSGIEECFATVYAPNTVKQIMAAVAYSRAVRAHFLLRDALALHAILCSGVDLSADTELQAVLKQLREGDVIHQEAASTEAVLKVQRIISETMTKAAANSRTAKLWKLYYDLIGLVQLYIFAERTGDWDLHLWTTREMIPIFAAAGHHNYIKSCLLYLHCMSNLESQLSEKDYKLFVKQGFFTIRRSSRFWSGVWSDMTIEQTLMRAFKSEGGMTRGRGITEATLHRWTLSMPACAEFTAPLEELLELKTETTEQHVDLTSARRRHDHRDAKAVQTWLSKHSPFNQHTPELISLAAGTVASSTVNSEQAMEIGATTLQSMLQQQFTFNTIRYERKNKVVPLSTVTKGVKIKGQVVIVDSEQILHRILSMKLDVDDMIALFGYELAPTAPALFILSQVGDKKSDPVSVMRPANKASLQTTILTKVQPKVQPVNTTTCSPDSVIHVVDGGYLLHKFVWPRPATYGQICKGYCKFVYKNYGQQSTIVFDSYDDPDSTKGSAHAARYGASQQQEVIFTPDNFVSVKQSDFLSCSANKTRLITSIIEELNKVGITSKIATGDADTLIAETAIKLAEKSPVRVICTDTDVLIILLARAPAAADITFVAQVKSQGPPKLFNISLLQRELGVEAKCLLFIHAMTGCDTTSAPHMRNKGHGFKLLKNEDIRNISFVFFEPAAALEDIVEAGEKFFLTLYDCKEEKLDRARYFQYQRSMSKLKLGDKFKIGLLPPTSDAAKFHTLRVYHQVQTWLGRRLDPTLWGFRREEGVLVPIVTEQPLVPDHLLDTISCNCSGDCLSFRCSCRKSDVFCTAMCGQCSGVNCSNCPPTEDCSESEDSETESPLPDRASVSPAVPTPSASATRRRQSDSRLHHQQIEKRSKTSN